MAGFPICHLCCKHRLHIPVTPLDTSLALGMSRFSVHHSQPRKRLLNHSQNFGILELPAIISLEKTCRRTKERKTDAEIGCNSNCCLLGKSLEKNELGEVILGDHNELEWAVRLGLHVNQVSLPTMPSSGGDDWLYNQALSGF